LAISVFGGVLQITIRASSGYDTCGIILPNWIVAAALSVLVFLFDASGIRKKSIVI